MGLTEWITIMTPVLYYLSLLVLLPNVISNSVTLSHLQCVKVPREVIKHVPKSVKKKICVSTKAHDDFGGYGHGGGHGGGYGGGHIEVHGGGGYDDHSDHGGYSSHHFRSALTAEVDKKESTKKEQTYKSPQALAYKNHSPTYPPEKSLVHKHHQGSSSKDTKVLAPVKDNRRKAEVGEPRLHKVGFPSFSNFGVGKSFNFS